KFSEATNKLFVEIGNVDFSAVEVIMEHAISCREVAYSIQTSPAFEFHGCQISTSLHEFRDKLITADSSLRKMYDKGSVDFRQLVEQSHGFILDAAESKHSVEGNIEKGLRGAEKFCYNNVLYFADIDKAKKKLLIIEDSLENLHDTSHNLSKLKEILVGYEDLLVEIIAQYDENTFEVTNDDLIYLNLAIKVCHNKFNQGCGEV
ncbi:10258_t:CDS:2, partial [Funneliformis geosporum]